MPPIQGITIPLVTPRSAGCRPDLDALKELIDFVVSRGVSSISIGSTTGEFVHYSLEQRRQMLACAAAHHRGPLIAGIAHSTLEGALELAAAAEGAGASALLVMPPHFFRYGQGEVREFFLRFVDSAPLGIPILLYNIPAFANEISCATACELLGSGRFAGIKDSSGSWESFLQLKEARDRHRFTLLVGNDRIFTRARTLGADGVVSGVACALPELLVTLERAILAGARDRAAALDQRLLEFIDWIDRFPAPMGIRFALAERGLRPGPEAVPLSQDLGKLAEEFRGWFRQWLPGVLEQAVGADEGRRPGSGSEH